LADLALARRLERAEARSNAEFVEARAKADPESGAGWIEVAGAYAMFDTVASPVTQTFGLGLFQTVTPAELELIEAFYRQRGAPVCHEVSPLADPALLALLNDRGYHPIELTSVMYRPIRAGLPLPVARNDRVQVRLVQGDERALWARVGARGWSEQTELADMILELMQLVAERSGALSFLAELDGQPVAAGALFVCDGVALLGGASTIPEARRQGAQQALLEGRLRYAAEHGCDLAMISAQPPGGASQRNAERQGFRIAYTRIKWRPGQPAG
jgi:hypothetical protein